MFARTSRTLLRPAWLEDALAIKAAIADEAIVRNLAMAPWPYTIEDATAFVRIKHGIRTPNFMIMCRTQASPVLIGSCGLLERNGVIEIGYWIARKYWGQGYATEAARAVLEIAHSLGHKQIHAGYYIDNPISGHVLRKLGFQSSGPVHKFHSIGRGCAADLMPMKINNLSDIISMNNQGRGILPLPEHYETQKFIQSAA